MKRKNIARLVAIAVIILAVVIVGCVEEENHAESPEIVMPTQKTPTQTAEPTATLTPSQPHVSDVDHINDGGTVRVGAFNIQVFGESKASKPDVMEVLGKIIRTYDVLAIQEIRDKSQTALPALVDTVNSDNSQYDYVVGERLGRTTSKEQYAYIYNTQTIRLDGTPHTYPEPVGDPFHREPYIASFEVLACNFDFILITIHVDPDEATEEINALDDVVRYAQSTYPDEQDFMVMGDLNADCSYFDEDSSSTMSGSDYYWCISNSVDTTTKSTDCTYDRIILTNPTAAYFTGDSGVFRYDIEYGLTDDETTAVSDHYPVYAEFSCNGGTSIPTPTSVTVTPAPTPEPTPTLTPTETDHAVRISDLHLADEWVKITNSGTSPVTVTGWKITDDDVKHTYIFPPFTLSSGATVTLHTGDGTDTATELYWGGRYVWNNDGDTARLYDSNGNLIDTKAK